MTADIKAVNDSVRHYEYSVTFPFEEDFDIMGQLIWFRDNANLSFYFVALYCITIYLLKLYMSDRIRLELKSFAIVWNFGLSIFSLLVVIRIWPDLFYDLREHGFDYTICDSSFLLRNKVYSFWMTVFTYSKFIEFGDTVLLVFRKRPLTFLHVYHHITISLGTFYFVRKSIPMARWVPLINGWIHTVMYGYFGAKIVNIKIPKLFSMFLTSMQICQMLYFVYIILIVNYWNFATGKLCNFSLEDSIIICPVIASYAILFLNFFYRTYINNTSLRKIIKKKE